MAEAFPSSPLSVHQRDSWRFFTLVLSPGSFTPFCTFQNWQACVLQGQHDGWRWYVWDYSAGQPRAAGTTKAVMAQRPCCWGHQSGKAVPFLFPRSGSEDLAGPELHPGQLQGHGAVFSPCPLFSPLCSFSSQQHFGDTAYRCLEPHLSALGQGRGWGVGWDRSVYSHFICVFV